MNGKVMCYRLDRKAEWSHWVSNTDLDTEMEFASPLALHDLTGDGFPNIIFTTQTPRDSMKTGKLVVLDHKGNKIIEQILPNATNTSSGSTNGGAAAPVVTEVNGRKLIAVNTHLSGMAVYEVK
jgi:hypothetical protein